MKRRLYYLADNLDIVDEVARLLQKQGITGWNFHVLSKDEAGLYRHHLHSATPLHTRDVWRFGERGAMIGVVLGFICSLIIIGGMGYFKNNFLLAAFLITALITLHGAWSGGLAGIANENYKIKRFHADIEQGRLLLMIDVSGAKHDRIKQALAHIPLQERGEDSVIALPFNPGRS
jgi:hypothetical protein